MKDQYNRTIDYIRISLTDQCNLNCCYCMPEGTNKCSMQSSLMQNEEILHLAALFRKAGIKKVKLTGGEPLLRRNIPELIWGLKEQCGMESVTITTNGVLLSGMLPKLVSAGLDGVNISIDSLDPVRYAKITGSACLPEVLEGVHTALSQDQLNVKLNCVPLENRADILALAALARDTRLLVRFIELMPIGEGKRLSGMRVNEILAFLEAEYGPAKCCSKPLGSDPEEVSGKLSGSDPEEASGKLSGSGSVKHCMESFGNGPAVYYDFPDFHGKIGFINAVSHSFCASCSRIRLTADGRIKGCLQYEAGANLKQALRDGVPDEALLAQITDAIYHKPKEHCFFQEAEHTHMETHPMSEIGG